MKNDMGLFGWSSKKEIIQPEAKCPFCLNTLPEIPQRHFKCDSCKKKVFVFKFESKLILTDETGAKKYRWLKKIDGTLNIFEKKKMQLTAKFGKEPSDRDVLWGLMQSSDNYYLSAEFLDEEGKDPKNALRGQYIKMLNNFKQNNTSKVQILTSKDERMCEECAKQDGMELMLEEAIKQMPLPCKKCTSKLDAKTSKFGWCRCTYLPIIE